MKYGIDHLNAVAQTSVEFLSAMLKNPNVDPNTVDLDKLAARAMAAATFNADRIQQLIDANNAKIDQDEKDLLRHGSAGPETAH